LGLPAAARLEGSKAFAKAFMQRHGIPTSACLQTDSLDEALDAARSGRFGFPLVIKADGLAAGKGVIIARSLDEAEAAIRQILEARILGEAGSKILLEQFLTGEEVSFLVFSDGVHALPMVPSQDHKTVFDNDLGPNTGGMGAYSADWILSPSAHHELMERIVLPTLAGMAAEGMPYRGILYFGLMLTRRHTGSGVQRQDGRPRNAAGFAPPGKRSPRCIRGAAGTPTRPSALEMGFATQRLCRAGLGGIPGKVRKRF
jgi:phosphoribosylamine--glycine ligase